MTLYKIKGTNRSLLALEKNFRIYLSTYQKTQFYTHKLSLKQVVYGLGEYHFGLMQGEHAFSQYDITEISEFKIYKIVITMNYGG